MRDFRLTAPQRDALRRLAKASPDTHEARRALALLDLARGESVTGVAGRYGVSRETVYQWAARLGTADLPGARLRDAPRSGRPAGTGRAAEELLRAALPTDPRRHGYRHPAWTAPLLQRHLRRQGVEASEATVRRALRRLGYRWKRPRFVLSRRDPHWRQAKGGSGAG
jgi:transposase